MITLLVGDNDFEKKRELDSLVAKSGLVAERYDGTSLEVNRLPDIMMGTTLFATNRLIVINDLSENTVAWDKFVDQIENVSSDIEIVLMEVKPDKRTTSYKKLSKVARVVDSKLWSDRDVGTAVSWLKNEASRMGLKLDNKSAQLVVARVGLDQWQLLHALEKLALADVVDEHVIEDLIDASPMENVFNLFDSALSGDVKKVRKMVAILKTTEDAYRLFSLLSSQAFQLAAVSTAGTDDKPAKDLGIHPYVIGKLKQTAKRTSRSRVRKIVDLFAIADDDMKVSKADPWILIEKALLEVATK